MFFRCFKNTQKSSSGECVSPPVVWEVSKKKYFGLHYRRERESVDTVQNERKGS